MRFFRIVMVAVILLAGAWACGACAIKAPLEDLAWVLASYGQPGQMQGALASPEVTAYFDSRDGTLEGSTGPNTYRATYKLDGMNLTISGMTVTEVASTDPAISAQESAYLGLLPKAERYEMDHGNLVIHSGNSWLIYKLGDRTLKKVNNWGD